MEVVFSYALGTVAAIVLAAVFGEECLRKRAGNARRRAELSARPVIDVKTWLREHCDPLGLDHEHAITVTGMLASWLKCEATQLLPADDFARLKLKPDRDILGFPFDDAFDSFKDVFFGMYPRVMECWETVAHEIVTLGDLIRLVGDVADEQEEPNR